MRKDVPESKLLSQLLESESESSEGFTTGGDFKKYKVRVIDGKKYIVLKPRFNQSDIGSNYWVYKQIHNPIKDFAATLPLDTNGELPERAKEFIRNLNELETLWRRTQYYSRKLAYLLSPKNFPAINALSNFEMRCEFVEGDSQRWYTIPQVLRDKFLQNLDSIGLHRRALDFFGKNFILRDGEIVYIDDLVLPSDWELFDIYRAIIKGDLSNQNLLRLANFLVASIANINARSSGDARIKELCKQNYDSTIQHIDILPFDRERLKEHTKSIELGKTAEFLLEISEQLPIIDVTELIIIFNQQYSRIIHLPYYQWNDDSTVALLLKLGILYKETIGSLKYEQLKSFFELIEPL